MTNYNFETNPEVCNATFDYINDQRHGSAYNISFELFATIEKLVSYVKVFLEDGSRIKENERMFMNAAFDFEKISEGIYSNPIARAIGSNLLQSMTFDPRLPYRPVRNQQGLLIEFCFNIFTGNIQVC